ncbi:hypothetical protein F5X96DRAFT_567017 [Biscogniauxia mediterranea]|nr:hypothetical protein F5X96DRAFT_567017 [Biscogniauxia mediterranea]
MASFLNFNQNISYFTIPVAFFLAMAPRGYSGFAGPGKKYFDPANPRTFAARLENADIDKDVKARILRAEACSANAFEALPLYAAAVVAGNVAGLPRDTLNALAAGYIASRAAYTWVYIWGQNNRKLADARTLVWGVGVGLVMTLFVKAGLRS